MPVVPFPDPVALVPAVPSAAVRVAAKLSVEADATADVAADVAVTRSVVTVEEIVDDFGPRNANAVILPSWAVTAIAHVPGGAYPSYAHGYYKRANDFYIAWDKIARERDTFLAWIKDNVLEKGPDAFARHAVSRKYAA